MTVGYAGGMNINPVNGGLTLHGALNMGGNWVEVWGNNQKTLSLNGVVSGTGGIAVKQNSIVGLTNNNTFSGGIWVEKGTVKLGGHTNAVGAGTVNVGTNATLDLSGYGAATIRPVTLNLYGKGTNDDWGALRKSTGSAPTWRGAINLGVDSKIALPSGGLNTYGTINAGSYTLYISNNAAFSMQSGSTLVGSKTTGDGALHKSGSSHMFLRPSSSLTGSIWLHQGEIRQYTDNSSTIPAGGIFRMSGGTTYRSDGTAARINAKNTQIDGDVTLGYANGGTLTFSGAMSLSSGTRTLSPLNAFVISLILSCGGFFMPGAGTIILTGPNDYGSGTTISAGTLQIGNNGAAGVLPGNVVNNAALVWHRSDSFTYAGAISGSGTMTKNGAGTLTLSGTSSFSGGTTVSAGTLLVSGSLGSSAMTVASGATLSGTGTVGPIVSLAGTISPGGAGTKGTLTVNGAAALGGGTYACDITGTGGTDCDKIAASGAVGAASGLTINLPNTAPSGFDPNQSYTWTIMSGSSASAANMSLGTKWSASGNFSVAAESNTIVIKYATAKPPTPTGLSASDGTSTAHVALSWTDVAGETGYVIYRNTANSFAGATAIYTNAANAVTYNDTSAAPGQKYYYWVVAVNASGTSDPSAPDDGYRKLSAPTGVAASDGTSTATITVTWTAVTGATSYNAYRNTANNPSGATALGAKASGFTDAVTPGQIYYYWIEAAASSSGSVSDKSASDSGYVKLTAPGSVAATENQSDKVTVTWSDVAGETGYAIYRHGSNNSGAASIIGTAAANATSYNDTTGVAGTTYYYWVRATNSTSQSMSDFSAPDTGMKILAKPTTPASNIQFSNLAATSYTVSWTRGNGDYVLVVARQGGTPAGPTDSTVYTANATFGTGSQTAAGSFVVYKGAGTSVAVTGLSAEMEYTFAVYEFNGADVPSYLMTGAPVASRKTLAVAPTIQAKNLVFANPLEVRINGIDWDNGNGVGRLLVAKEGSPVDVFPANGTVYSANTNFGRVAAHLGGGNYVIWDGSGTTGMADLTRDVVYHFRVFEYTGSGETIHYNVDAAVGNPASQTTCAQKPTGPATDLAIDTVGTTSFRATWTKGTLGTNTLIVVKEAANPTQPEQRTTYVANTVFGLGDETAPGSYVVYTNTGTSVTVTGLTPGTRYVVWAYSFNGATGAENYRTTDPAKTDGYTLMGEPTQATNINFDNLNDTSYRVSFTVGNGLNRLVVAKAGGAVSWAPTDGVAYSGQNNNFGSAADLGSGNKLVHVGTSPFTLSGLTAATDYHVRIFEYNGTNDTLNYNANAASGNPANRYTLSVEPTAYGTLSATAQSDTAIKVDWGAATGASGYLIVRKTGSAPSGLPTDGTAYAQGNAIGDGTVVHVATSGAAGSVTDGYNTAANTTYYYQIFPFAYDGTPAHATHNYRTSGIIPTANATTGVSEPAQSSTLTSFLPVSGSSAKVVWNNAGAADGTLILIRSGAAVNEGPSDWNSYSASTVFGSGDEMGNGNYVVYATAGKSGTVTVTGLSAGTTYHVAIYPYNGSGSMLNYRTTSPARGSVTILPDPSAATATVDGKTMVRLAWTNHVSYEVMIVYKEGSASSAPVQGTAYSVGDACGGGTVIYKGSGASLEHVVASGKAHHYAFYSYSGNTYSAGLTKSGSTTAFAAGEVVDTFSYTNMTSLAGLNGETGWGGAWYGSDVGSFSNVLSSLGSQANYPEPSGNKLWVHAPDNESRAAFRPLGKEYKSGRIYFSYMMQYQWKGDTKYAGLSLFWNDSAEKLFIGKIHGKEDKLGIGGTEGNYTLNQEDTYIIAGYYDWAAGEAKAKAFYVGGQAVPEDEPISWDVTHSVASNMVDIVNNVRLISGATSGRLGDVYFDEVRISTNWAGLLGVTPSKPVDPVSASLAVDGHEMLRLAWTKNGAGNDVMILHKTSAIATDPTDGVGYAAGDTIDGATVIYRGGATALEHVVAAGSANYYKFYSVNSANYYSDGVDKDQTMGSYAVHEVVNPFSYTNGTVLGSANKGGQGFGNNSWSTGGSGTWRAELNPETASDEAPRFVNSDNYPPMAGNLVRLTGLGNNESGYAERQLNTPYENGTVYVAFMMSYRYDGASKWAGLSLLDNNTEKAFFGKGAGVNYHTLAIGDGSSTWWAADDLRGTGDNDGRGDTGRVYLVVGKYDFTDKRLQASVWSQLANDFPATEPGSWQVSQDNVNIAYLNKIRLHAGSGDADNTISAAQFDEIRIGTSWAQIVPTVCATWVGGNALNGSAWSAPASDWLGNQPDFEFQSYPIGLGQVAALEFDWAQDGGFAASSPMNWIKNENNNSFWSNRVQLTSAGVITSRFSVAGSSCAAQTTTNPALTVQNLNPPTGASATRDGVNTNSQINLSWTKGVSGSAKDVIVIRQLADSNWTAPANGTTYHAGDPVGNGTVAYRGSAENFNDTGLAPDTTYYYRFYSENWSYYSVSYASANASTAPGGQTITIDGNPADWKGTASVVVNNSVSSAQEFIWTDKADEQRTDHGDHENADIREFRVYADADWVYFLVKLKSVTDASKPYVSIGVDTRQDGASEKLNWLGDDSGTFIGGDYAVDGEGARHFPEYLLDVHYVDAVGEDRIEMWAHDGTYWRAPETDGDTTVAISSDHNAIELKVARADLNLVGAKTARFTVASFINTGSWNNDGDGTAHIGDNTADAVDSISIPPWGMTDNDLKRSAWDEDISDGDIDFWLDVKFGESGLVDNQRPSAPTLTGPLNGADVAANPTLWWEPASDADGFVTGYLLEVSTNENFNGVNGADNGEVDLRVNLDADTLDYRFSTSASQYWWRVRARDNSGALSAAATRSFKVVGKLDNEGPKPTLVYIGTNVAGYLAGDYDEHIERYGYIQHVYDNEIQDANNVFGFVLRWDDPSGVYATNQAHANFDGGPGAGEFAFNIVSDNGRVSPNWDLLESNTVSGAVNDWGADKPFYETNTYAVGNTGKVVTNWVHEAFSIADYDPDIKYFLTVSAEDAYTEGGSWAEYGSWDSYQGEAAGKYHSGWCADGPNTARNVTTNYMIEILVTDDDTIPPGPSTALGWKNNGENAALVISNAAGRLEYVEGQGQGVLYQITDGDLADMSLSFSFNAYDSYYKGVALGTDPTYQHEGRTLTNSFFVIDAWQTNWANYNAGKSLVANTRNAETMLTWHWDELAFEDVSELWGDDDLTGDQGIEHLVQLHLYDVDNDREGDQANALTTFGRLQLVDDDTEPPVVSSLTVTGTGLAREYVLTNLVEWTFDGSGSDRLTADKAKVATAISSSNFTNSQGAITGTDVITVSAGFATGGTRSWLFSLWPDAGKTFKAISMSFDTRVSSVNGPDTWEIWGTMPGGSPALWCTGIIDLTDPENPLGTNWNSCSATLAMPSAADDEVQFELKAYVADTNHLTGTGTATWSVDNLIVSGYVLGEAGGVQVTDHDLAYGTAVFSFEAQDEYSGIDGTTGVDGRGPRVDFWNVSQSVTPITNAFITGGWSAATNTQLSISGAAPAADKKKIALGSAGGTLVYNAQVTVTDADRDRDGDWLSHSVSISTNVFDDDTAPPKRGYLYGGPLGVFVNGQLTKSVASGNNKDYRINDSQLQTAASTSLTVRVNLYDYSGWTVPELCVSNATSGRMSTNGWFVGVLTDDADTTNKPDAFMEWSLGLSQAQEFFNSYEGVTNEIRIVSVWDKDDDRQDVGGNNIDALELTNARLGYVTFIDDDVGQPNVQSNYSEARSSWCVPQVFLGTLGDMNHNRLDPASTVLANTNSSAVIANLTNIVYDSQLAKASAEAPLSVVIPAFDTGGGGSGRTIKGLQRGATLTEESVNEGYNITNSSLTIGSVLVDNTANYRDDWSSPQSHTKIAAQFPTSVWAFTSFSYAEVGDWLAPETAWAAHAMSVHLYDADDNRPTDQKDRVVSIGTMLVRDNDTVAPSRPANVKVNGQTMVGPLDRDTAAWTNTPEFKITFEPSKDGPKAPADWDVTGIGEYRTATKKADIGPDTGTPLAVPAEGALANYGFEMSDDFWTLSGGAIVSGAHAAEGAYSLKMAAGAAARQIVPLMNGSGYAPRVTVRGAAYRGATDGTLSVIGLDADGHPVAGEAFDVEFTGESGRWVVASSNPEGLAATVEYIEIKLVSGADTYWDDIHLEIELLDGGVPVDEIGTVFTATEQGLTTNYLFAVDRDNNRPGDRMASSAPADNDIPSFGIAYDITPPTPVAMPANGATTETVADPTTQFDLQWSTANVGPDNLDDPRHPDYPNAADRDKLSPWHSYKIYYGTYDATTVPQGDSGHGTGNAYIFTNFIATGAYTNWPSVTATNTVADPSVGQADYLALTNVSCNEIRLYDLDFDQDYAVVIVGLDRAGNEGPASPSSWATNNTIRFALTQGVLRVRGEIEAAFGQNHNLRETDRTAAALYWIAAGPTNEQGAYLEVTREYDLIYSDATSFNESSNWVWQKVGTIQSNWFVDAEGQDQGLTGDRGKMRFYRASYKDRWQRTNPLTGLKQRPLASEEVYALHNVILGEGVNFVGLHGKPYTNTFAGVFGTDTNIWPAGASPAAGATRIEFFQSGTNPIASAVYFFGPDGNWYQSDGDGRPVTTNLQSESLFQRGFSITLPTNLAGRGYATTNVYDTDNKTNVAALAWHSIMQVPTNDVITHEIACGYNERDGSTWIYQPAYTVISLNLPVSIHPSDLKLPANFVGGSKGQADWLFTWNTRTKQLFNNTYMYRDATGTWRFVNTDGTVPPGHIRPNDVLVIMSHNGGVGNTWQWSYSPTNFYKLPTRWMGE